ncbi:MAG: histidine phosphatase family protein [Bacteroidota bacterium]
MKTVLLFRHGKSDWEADYGNDHERPLAKRGRKAANKMGRWLAQVGPMPDRVLTSTALRAQDTVARAAQAGGWTVPIEPDPALYLAAPAYLIRVMRSMPDEVETLMLVGHEPGWSETVEALMGGGSVRFPTAALAHLVCHVDRWEAVTPGCATLHALVIPRALP